MKKILIVAFILAFIASSAVADLPIRYPDMVKLYGKPDYANRMTGKRIFNSEGMTINAYAEADSDVLISIEFNRSTPFYEMEIDGLLKSLYADEEWKQSGKDWVLKKAKTTAHWNGEGKITIQGS